MKTTKLLLLFIILFSTSFGQEPKKTPKAKVPLAVKSAFAKMYPEAHSASWHKKNNKYEALFDNGIGECSVLFNSKGSWLAKETIFVADSLPEQLRNYVKENYSGYNLKHATLVSTYKRRSTWQIVIVEKTVVFDKAGKFIREEKNQ